MPLYELPVTNNKHPKFEWRAKGRGADCFALRSTPIKDSAGLEIATDTVANAINIFSLATKNSRLVAKVATRFLYDLDLN